MENKTETFIKPQVVLDAVRGSKSVQEGAFFSVTFRKRTNGELRTISAKLSKTVKRGKTGGGLSFDPNEKGLVMVLDANKVKENLAEGAVGDESVKGAFRSFPVDGVVELKVDGSVLRAA